MVPPTPLQKLLCYNHFCLGDKMKLKFGLIALLAAFTLTACGDTEPSGRYVIVDPTMRVELGLTELTFTEDGVTGVQYDAFPFEKMDWELKDEKLILTDVIVYQYFDPGERTDVYEYDFEMKDDSIFLDGVEFKKAE